MAMTRKDYDLLAQTINANRRAAQVEPAFDVYQRAAAVEVLRLLSLDLSRQLGTGNPHFNRVRFLEACGTTDLLEGAS